MENFKFPIRCQYLLREGSERENLLPTETHRQSLLSPTPLFVGK